MQRKQIIENNYVGMEIISNINSKYQVIQNLITKITSIIEELNVVIDLNYFKSEIKELQRQGLIDKFKKIENEFIVKFNAINIDEDLGAKLTKHLTAIEKHKALKEQIKKLTETNDNIVTSNRNHANSISVIHAATKNMDVDYSFTERRVVVTNVEKNLYDLKCSLESLVIEINDYENKLNTTKEHLLILYYEIFDSVKSNIDPYFASIHSLYLMTGIVLNPNHISRPFIMNDMLAIQKLLLKTTQPIDLNCPDEIGNIPLFYAVRFGHVKLVSQLIILMNLNESELKKWRELAGRLLANYKQSCYQEILNTLVISDSEISYTKLWDKRMNYADQIAMVFLDYYYPVIISEHFPFINSELLARILTRHWNRTAVNLEMAKNIYQFFNTIPSQEFKKDLNYCVLHMTMFIKLIRAEAIKNSHHFQEGHSFDRRLQYVCEKLGMIDVKALLDENAKLTFTRVIDPTKIDQMTNAEFYKEKNEASDQFVITNRGSTAKTIPLGSSTLNVGSIELNSIKNYNELSKNNTLIFQQKSDSINTNGQISNNNNENQTLNN